MIQHNLAQDEGTLVDFLSTELCMEPTRALWLAEFGAVYVNHKRARGNMPIKKADYIRTHTSPRRFPVADVDWASRIVKLTDDFVVVHKPNSIPTHASVDNLFENVAAQISKHLNSPIYVTHRLDVATSGLLCVARTKEFQRNFNIALRDGFVEKEYRAQVDQLPTEDGMIEHYMEPSSFLPRVISKDPVEGWQKCLLEIKEKQTTPLGKFIYLRLWTGRTHQIRAQLSALGAPLVGDRMYRGQADWHGIENIGLTADRLRFRLADSDFWHDFSLPR